MTNRQPTLGDIDVFVDALRASGFFVDYAQACCSRSAMRRVIDQAGDGQPYVTVCEQSLEQSFGDAAIPDGPLYLDGVCVAEILGEDGEIEYRPISELSEDEAGAIALIAAADRFMAVMRSPLYLNYGLNAPDAHDDDIHSAGHLVLAMAQERGLLAGWTGEITDAVVIGRAVADEQTRSVEEA